MCRYMALATGPKPLDQEINPGWCGTLSTLERKMLAMSFIFTVIITAIIVVVAVLEVYKVPTPVLTWGDILKIGEESFGETCRDEHCRKAGLYFATNMNRHADPCEDFHEFVCGNWTKNQPIPDDKGSYGPYEVLRSDLAKVCIGVLEKPDAPDFPTGAVDNARALFQSCLKTELLSTAESVVQLRSLLQSVGLSPEVSSDGNKVPPGFIWTVTLSKIVCSYGLNFILRFTIQPDPKNASRNTIFLDQPSSFGLGRSFLLERNPSMVKAYKTYIGDSLSLLRKDFYPQMETVVRDIVEFEINMANLTRSKVDRRNTSSWYFPMKISDLQIKVPGIPFLEYLTDILHKSGQNVAEDTVVVVKAEAYFSNLIKLLTTTKPGVVHNYLAWRLVQSLGSSLSKVFRDLKFQFDKVTTGIQKEKQNADRCFGLTDNYLEHAVGSLYIEKIGFMESTKRDLEEMVKYLSKAFRTLVDKNDWMDEPTKIAAKKKLEKMVGKFGYPEWTKNTQELNKYYEKLQPLNKNDFFESYKRTMKFTTETAFAKLGKMNNPTTEWNSAASVVNAFYSPAHNSITFPAGILQLPFYGEHLKVLNYGALGHIIGHEITHGFDDFGGQYDGDGNLRNWWTPSTLAKFTEKKNCFIEQYSNITDNMSGLHLNGGQTIGENIADNGGVREAYKAYEMSGRESVRLPGLEEFDDRQLYFIAVASIWCTQFRKEDLVDMINQGVHVPGMYRAYIPLANTKEFADAFQCPLNSKMNPKKKCVIW